MKKKFTQKAFTLIELLIVIGILGVLLTAVIVNINPLEAQRKARDTVRLKDMAELESILVQLINDGVTIPAASSGDLGNASGASSATASRTTNCTSTSTSPNWLGIDVCNYAKSVPIDPRNTQSITAIGTTTSQTAAYSARVSSGNYEVRTFLESPSNLSKLTSDGGEDNAHFELFSSNSLL
jgi:prepilin-type N-terminal cleavage/methylation domain-containing protein